MIQFSAMISPMRWLPAAIGLLACGCSPRFSPTAPTAPLTHGLPAHIELAATPGVGPSGGTATLTARVQDAYAALLPDQPVTFATSVGTLSRTTVATNEDGIASTGLTAPDGEVLVTARVGAIGALPVSVAMQPVLAPPPATPNPPPLQPPALVVIYVSVWTLHDGPFCTSTLPICFGMPLSDPVRARTTSLPANVPVRSLRWTFGDGSPAVFTTAVGQTVDHRYQAPGYMAIRVEATLGDGRIVSNGVYAQISVWP